MEVNSLNFSSVRIGQEIPLSARAAKYFGAKKGSIVSCCDIARWLYLQLVDLGSKKNSLI